MNKFSKDKILIAAVSLLMASGLIGGTLIYSRQIKSRKIVTKEIQSSLPTPTPIETSSPTSPIKDSEFYAYTSPNFGFSLKLPKTAINQYGGCSFNGEYNAYTSEFVGTPVKVFEDVKNSKVYIAFEHFYQLTPSTETDSGAITYTDCKLVKNNLETILPSSRNNPEQNGIIWEINFRKILSDADLTKFVQDVDGSTCSIKSKKNVGKNLFDIEILQGDASAGSESKCPLNYKYIFLYNSDKKLAMSWHTGQTDRVFREYDNATSTYQSYDRLVTKTLEFE